MIREEILRHVASLPMRGEEVKVAKTLKEMVRGGELSIVGDSFKFPDEDEGFGISFSIVPYRGLFLTYTHSTVGLEKLRTVEYCLLGDSFEVSPSSICRPSGEMIARFSEVRRWMYGKFPEELRKSFVDY